MKQLLVTITFIITALSGFSQTKAITGELKYGPVPYRTPEQTIGEYYVVAPPPDKKDVKIYSIYFMDTDGTPEYGKDVLYKNVIDKSLKLINIKDKTGIFKSNDNISYLIDLQDKVSFGDVVPAQDLEQARQLFLNKPLWIKNYEAKAYNEATDKYDDVSVAKFQPVTITDISPGRHLYWALLFTFKTKDGKIACLPVDVSGTNTYRQPQYFLENNFYLKDPKLTYHFSPAVWRQIEAGDTPIGMAADAFELVMGKPTHINRSRVGNTFHEQWVYGEYSPRFYYFTNDKYTGKN